MQHLAPAAGTIGAAAIGWVAWELSRVVLLRGVFAGITGAAIDLRWPPGGSFAVELMLPLLGVLALSIVSWLLTRRRDGRLGFGLFGLGVVALLGWTLVTGLAGLSAFLDTVAPLPVFFQLPDPLSWWTAWGVWWNDLALLTALAMLLAVGPRSPTARRAAFCIGLAVLVDSFWRAFVALTSGQVPWLIEGPGVWGLGVHLIWLLAGLFGLAFMFVFGNLPDRDGPPPRVITVLLVLDGLWAGLQGAGLFTAGTLDAIGLDGRLIFPLPLYEGMLAALRMGMLAVGTLTVMIGLRREG